MPQQLLLFPGVPAPTSRTPSKRKRTSERASLLLARVQRGDLWQLGSHRLLCGDSTSAEDVARLMGGEQARMVVTSPPYSDQRTYKLGAFDWDALMCGAFAQMVNHLAPDGQILINLGLAHKNRRVDFYWQHWLEQCTSAGWPLFGWYVWDKGPAFPGDWHGRLAPTFELVFHFAKQSRRPHKWIPTKAATGDRDPTRSFRDADGSLRGSHSPDKYGQPFKIPDSVIRIHRELSRGVHTAHHPATFPVALPDFLMRSWSDAGDVIYEPFAGAGTSFIAAQAINRRCYSMEIEPQYCDVILARWEHETGQHPILLSRDASSVA